MMTEFYVGLLVKCPLLLSEFNKKNIRMQQLFVDFPIVKFHENDFSSSETYNMRGNEQTVDECNR
jgi:hypothetical protein